jgi:hypothetical protein
VKHPQRGLLLEPGHVGGSSGIIAITGDSDGAVHMLLVLVLVLVIPSLHLRLGRRRLGFGNRVQRSDHRFHRFDRIRNIECLP